MGTVELSKSVALAAGPDVVWDFVSDFAGFAAWQPHIDSVEMQPNGDRKVFFARGDTKLDRVTSRDDGAMTFTYELVPGQPGPPGAPPIQIAATFTVSSAERGSEVEYAITAEVPDPMEDMARQGIGGDIDGALAGLLEKFGESA